MCDSKKALNRIEELKAMKKATELELLFIDGEIEKEKMKACGMEPPMDFIISQAIKYAKMQMAMKQIFEK